MINNQLATITTNELMDLVRDTVYSDAKGQIISSKGVADTYGVQLCCYESGQSLVNGNQYNNIDALTTLLTNANRNYRMRGIHNNYYRLWAKYGGGGVLNVYSYCSGYSKYGSWGMIEYQDQDLNTAYKYQSIKHFNDNYQNSIIPKNGSTHPHSSANCLQSGIELVIVVTSLFIIL